MLRDRKIIAIATGDPAGIGPEISLRTARDPAVRAACRTILAGDPDLIARHASACGIAADLRSIATVDEADWSDDRINVLTCPRPDRGAITLGRTGAAAGHASIAFVRAAVRAALAGAVDAVVAAPQNETSIALAGISFDGHPSFVALETGRHPDAVYLMLCAGGLRIVHATLHQSVRQAIAMITPERIGTVVRTTEQALRRFGISSPRIAVGGLNPHAGEGGLFGREEIEVLAPAIAAAAAEGIAVRGPFGPDLLLQQSDVDAFVVMLHDHGHIPVKLLAPNGAVAMTIGTPILFASVAHGCAHDIAGRGVASPQAMIEAILSLSNVQALNAGADPQP